MSSIPSLIKWTGSKRLQARVIASMFPPHCRYVEPFVGGGALLYLAAHHGAVANDIYPPLVALWRLVRDDPATLVAHYRQEWERLNRELNSLEVDQMGSGSGQIPRTYYDVRSRFNAEPNPCDLNFLMRTCVNGIVRFNRLGHFNNSFHLSRRGMNPSRFDIVVRAWCDRLQGVDFFNLDYKELLCDLRKGDLVYLDPPYANTVQRYVQLVDPVELCGELELLNSRDVRWMLSFDGVRGSRDMRVTLPDGLYKRHVLLSSGCSAVKKVLSGPIEQVTESLYLNY